MSKIQFLYCTSYLLCMLAGLTACQHTQRTSGDETSMPYYNTPDLTPVWLDNPNDVNQKITHRIADFSFHDQNNKLITQETIANKVHVASFFFTACPSICPKINNLLKSVQDTFRHEPNVVMLSYSVTPWLDSVSRLHRYADQKGIYSDKWHLLTGERGKIYGLARRSYFAEEEIGFTKDSTEFIHTEHVILVDQNRRIRGVYHGTVALDIDKLILDIQTLLKEN